MIVTTRRSLLRLLLWQWRHALVMLLAATLAVFACEWQRWEANLLPSLPLAVVGGALGIFAAVHLSIPDPSAAFAECKPGRIWSPVHHECRLN